MFADELGEDSTRILKILEKGEMSDMEDLIERIRTDLINRGKTEGIVETIANVIKNMLQQNEDEEKIMKYTNTKREDIQKAKKELGMI